MELGSLLPSLSQSRSPTPNKQSKTNLNQNSGFFPLRVLSAKDKNSPHSAADRRTSPSLFNDNSNQEWCLPIDGAVLIRDPLVHDILSPFKAPMIPRPSSSAEPKTKISRFDNITSTFNNTAVDLKPIITISNWTPTYDLLLSIKKGIITDDLNFNKPKKNRFLRQKTEKNDVPRDLKKVVSLNKTKSSLDNLINNKEESNSSSDSETSTVSNPLTLQVNTNNQQGPETTTDDMHTVKSNENIIDPKPSESESVSVQPVQNQESEIKSSRKPFTEKAKLNTDTNEIKSDSKPLSPISPNPASSSNNTYSPRKKQTIVFNTSSSPRNPIQIPTNKPPLGPTSPLTMESSSTIIRSVHQSIKSVTSFRKAGAYNGPAALVIGIGSYQDLHYPPSPWSVRDSIVMAELLQQLGYNVILMHTGFNNKSRHPTSLNVRKALSEVLPPAIGMGRTIVAVFGRGVGSLRNNKYNSEIRRRSGDITTGLIRNINGDDKNVPVEKQQAPDEITRLRSTSYRRGSITEISNVIALSDAPFPIDVHSTGIMTLDQIRGNNNNEECALFVDAGPLSPNHGLEIGFGAVLGMRGSTGELWTSYSGTMGGLMSYYLLKGIRSEGLARGNFPTLHSLNCYLSNQLTQVSVPVKFDFKARKDEQRMGINAMNPIPVVNDPMCMCVVYCLLNKADLTGLSFFFVKKHKDVRVHQMVMQGLVVTLADLDPTRPASNEHIDGLLALWGRGIPCTDHPRPNQRRSFRVVVLVHGSSIVHLPVMIKQARAASLNITECKCRVRLLLSCKTSTCLYFDMMARAGWSMGGFIPEDVVKENSKETTNHLASMKIQRKWRGWKAAKIHEQHLMLYGEEKLERDQLIFRFEQQYSYYAYTLHRLCRESFEKQETQVRSDIETWEREAWRNLQQAWVSRLKAQQQLIYANFMAVEYFQREEHWMRWSLYIQRIWEVHIYMGILKIAKGEENYRQKVTNEEIREWTALRRLALQQKQAISRVLLL